MGFPAPMKIVLTVVIIAFIAAGFWMLDWKAKDDQIKELNTEILAKKAEYEETHNKLAQLPIEKDRNVQLQAELQEVIQEQLMPESESEFVPSYIADVERLVEQQRTRMGDPDFLITNLTPEAAGQRGEGGVAALAGYPTRGFQMTLTGRYSTVIDFLRQLGALKLKRLVTISKVTLSGNPDQNNMSKSPSLNVTLPITVYLREGGSK